MGMPIDPLCSLCHQEPGSDSHLFRDCPLLLHIWSSSPLLKLRPSFSSNSFIHWCVRFVANLSSPPLGLLDSFISMLWTIWVFCNHARFRDAMWDPGEFKSVMDGWRVRCSEVRFLHRHSKASQLCHRGIGPPAPISESSPFSVATADIFLISDGACGCLLLMKHGLVGFFRTRLPCPMWQVGPRHVFWLPRFRQS